MALKRKTMREYRPEAQACPVCGTIEIGHQCLGPNHKFMLAESKPEITEIEIMRVVDHIREKGGVGIEVNTPRHTYILLLYEFDEM
jgi:hypothetical protein